MQHRHFVTAVILAALLALPVIHDAGAETPLLQPGKKALYERVLTRPGARLAKIPGRAGLGDSRILNAFSQLYVYERRPEDGQDWLRVAVDTKGTGQGWVAEQETVPWKQQLILVLTNRGTVRDRILFFDSRADLEDLLRADQPAKLARTIADTLARGGAGSAGGRRGTG